jgi:hypothetical protein
MELLVIGSLFPALMSIKRKVERMTLRVDRLNQIRMTMATLNNNKYQREYWSKQE